MVVFDLLLYLTHGYRSQTKLYTPSPLYDTIKVRIFIPTFICLYKELYILKRAVTKVRKSLTTTTHVLPLLLSKLWKLPVAHRDIGLPGGTKTPTRMQ